MIISFKCKETEKIWNGKVSRKFSSDIQQKALRALRKLNEAREVNDLQQPPSNHLKRLEGTRKGQWRIRVNRQWRICFYWENNEAYDVELVDYH